MSDIAAFSGSVDLAAAALGGEVLGTSDEFFAEASNLTRPGRAVFVEGKFTERGKWMDGWESRRRRGPGYDWCVLKLGVMGKLEGFDIDTQHFVGNHPAFASVEGLAAPRETPLDALLEREWHELLAQRPLAPGSRNLFAALDAPAVSHLRLNVFPDGGVARFRAYGRVIPDSSPPELDAVERAHVTPGLVDLAALRNGGLPLACSDARFGPMHHLIAPGRAENMGGGWETRRRRGEGFDWIVVALGARGTVELVEVDTSFFKGNFPERCSLEAVDAPDARITDLLASRAWSELLPATPLRADHRHFFGRDALASHAAISHVRLNIYPDGGVSRLRLWGKRLG